MILTMAKYHENLLKDSTLSLLLIAKFFSSLKTKKILKTRNVTFLRITRYYHFCCHHWTFSGQKADINRITTTTFFPFQLPTLSPRRHSRRWRRARCGCEQRIQRRRADVRRSSLLYERQKQSSRAAALAFLSTQLILPGQYPATTTTTATTAAAGNGDRGDAVTSSSYFRYSGRFSTHATRPPFGHIPFPTTTTTTTAPAAVPAASFSSTASSSSSFSTTTASSSSSPSSSVGL